MSALSAEEVPIINLKDLRDFGIIRYIRSIVVNNGLFSKNIRRSLGRYGMAYD